MEVKDKLTVTPVPPLKVTVCGLFEALSVISSVALKIPVADGVNVTLTVQVLPEAGEGVSVAPVQVSAVLANSPGSAPPIVAVEMMRGEDPILVTVTLLAALVVPRGWGGKAMLGGDKATEGSEIETMLANRLETLTVPIPEVKSQPVPAWNAG